MTNVIYKQFLVNVCKCLDGTSTKTHPLTVDLSICSYLVTKKDQFIPIGSRSPLKPITLLSRTLVIDLEKGPDEIFESFNRQNKQKIKRAERECYHHEVLLTPNDKEVQSYIVFFQKFAKWKGIQSLPEDRFRKAAKAGVISITWMKDENHTPLCGHAYLHVGDSVNMIHSASHRDGKNSSSRNTIGRANRLLHWKNILYYQKRGIKWYDFSGIFINPVEYQKKNINDFKRSFGGKEIDEVKIFQAHSIIGKILLVGIRWRWRTKPEYIRGLKTNSKVSVEQIV